MAQYYYDKNGNYGGKILSEEEESQKGCLTLIGGVLLVVGVVIYEYWYIIAPIALVILIICIAVKYGKSSNKATYDESDDYQPTPKVIEAPRWIAKEDPSKSIELIIGHSYIATYPDGHEIIFWFNGGHPPKVYFDGDTENLIPFSQIEDKVIDIREAL